LGAEDIIFVSKTVRDEESQSKRCHTQCCHTQRFHTQRTAARPQTL